MNLAHYLHLRAIESPDRVALRFENGNVTYAELARSSARIRAYLPKASRIGILAHRSPFAFASVQAVLASGAAFVPIKPHTPAPYHLQVLGLAEVSTLLVGDECVPSLAELLKIHPGPLEIVAEAGNEKLRELLSDKPGIVLREIGSEPGGPEPDIVAPSDGLACIFFTSGSTGIPKGVRVQHDSVVAYIEWFVDHYSITEEDRFSHIFDLPFDAALHDIFSTWKTGASLVVIPDRHILLPIDYVAKHGITIWFAASSFPLCLESFGRVADGALPGVRLSIFGGEKLTWRAIEIWKRIAPNGACTNLYGPTEATIVSSYFDIPPTFAEADCYQGGVPIGRILPMTRAEIRRDDGSLCDPMEEGLLFLAGPQVTPGYLDPTRDVGAFFERDGVRWYNTGDLVLTDRNGDIQFVGRKDFQVKVMGCRIELGEIEAVLLRETEAAFAVAEVLRGSVDEIVCVMPSSLAPRKNELRKIAKDKLEPYMVPRIWKFVDDLPRNSNGKIDRNALKASWKTTADQT